MFDLNAKEYKESSIFNGGIAGRVDNVSISIEERGADEPETYAPYRLVATDDSGAQLKGWFNYPTPNPSKDDEANEKTAKMYVGRVVSIARAVMGKDYEFPSGITNAKEAYDVLFKIIKDNAGAKKYNVFVTFGTPSYPNKKGYLGFRFFNFIEDAAAPTGRLSANAGDLMEKLVADEAPKSPSTTTTSSGTTGWA